jgi:hypothetical protein
MRSEPRPRRRGRSRDASAAKASPKTSAAASGLTASRDASRAAPPARSEVTGPAGFICPPCGRFVAIEVNGVVLRAGRGSPPRFCSPGCRQAAYRRRQAGVAEDVALQLRGGRGRSLAGWKGAGHE